MFPISDPQFHLDLYHQHAAELRGAAEQYRTARAATGGRHRRGGLRLRWARHARPVRAPAAL
jgi:hypothetical protein